MNNKKKWIRILLILLASGMAGIPAPAKVRAEPALTPEFGDIVPLFNDARVLAVKQTREFVRAHFKAPADAQAIIDFYRRSLEDRGWRMITPQRPDIMLEGMRRSRRGMIHLTFACLAKKDRATDFWIRLDYVQGRE